MVVDEGLLALIRFILQNAGIATKIGLYSNDYTPDHTTTMANLTEATFTGYAQKDANTLLLNTTAINGLGEGENDGPNMTWTCTADPAVPEDIHGIFVTIKDDTGATKLFAAAKFAAPVTITLTGDFVTKQINWLDANLP